MPQANAELCDDYQVCQVKSLNDWLAGTLAILAAWNSMQPTAAEVELAWSAWCIRKATGQLWEVAQWVRNYLCFFVLCGFLFCFHPFRVVQSKAFWLAQKLQMLNYSIRRSSSLQIL